MNAIISHLREIEWLCDGREDVDDGVPNIFMKIAMEARAAIDECARATGGAV